MAELFKAIAALPIIIGFIRELMKIVQDKFGPNWSQRMLDITDSFSKYREAKTDEEKRDAEKKIAQLFNS